MKSLDLNVSEFMHGGHCCGITHLYNFFLSPGTEANAREQHTYEEWKKFKETNPGHYARLYQDVRPAETALERLEEKIKEIEEGLTVPDDTKMSDGTPYFPKGRMIRRGRPSGIIEIVLIGGQKKLWTKELDRLGFRLVTETNNSNSHNTISVYHRVSSDVPTITKMREKSKAA